jgi:hypothetical protein
MEGLKRIDRDGTLRKEAFISAALRLGGVALRMFGRGAGAVGRGTKKAASFLNGKPQWLANRQANALNSAGKLGEATDVAKSGIGWKGAVGWTVGPEVAMRALTPSAENSAQAMASGARKIPGNGLAGMA